MESTRYSFSIDWLSGASPLWLLILVPLAVALTWWLYRPQLNRITSRQRWLLLSVRIVFVVAVALLIFRPRLEIVQTETFGGRHSVITSPSATMALPLSPSPNSVLAAIDLRLNPSADEKDTAGHLIDLAWFLRGLADRQTDGFLAGSAYWNFLDAQREPVEAALGALPESLTSEQAAFFDRLRHQLAPRDADENTLRAQVRELRAQLTDLLDQQALALESADQPSTPEADKVAAMTRIELAREFANNTLADTLTARFPTQRVSGMLDTEVTTALQAGLDDDSRRPLDGIILLSDGLVWHGDEALEPLIEAYTRAGIPIHVVAFGEAIEPPDLAVLQLDIPTKAIQNEPLPFRYRLKNTLSPQGDVIEPEWSVNGQSVDSPNDLRRTAAGGSGFLEAKLTPGPQTVSLALPVQDGEITPDNNALDVWLTVRESPYRVLVLESGTGWWQGHIAHTLARIPWVDLERRALQADQDVQLGENDLILFALGENADSALAQRWLDASRLDNLPIVLLGNIPATLAPKPLQRQTAAGPLDTWHRTIDGLAAWPTRRWNLPREQTVPAPSGQAEIWLTSAGEPLWGWTADEDGTPTVVLSLPAATLPMPAAREADYSRAWVNLIEWLETLARDNPAAPLRTRLGEPVRIYSRDVLDEPTLRFDEDRRITPETVDRTGPWHSYTFTPEQDGLWQLFTEGQTTALARTDLHYPRPRLANLARHDAFLRSLAARTGGHYTLAHQADAILPWLETSLNTETRRFLFSLWSSPWTLGFLLLLLLAEWIYRKRIGLL